MNLDDLARQVQRTQPISVSVRNQMPGPAEGSPALTEMAAARNDYERTLIRDGGHAVYARLSVAEDYLYTIGGMLPSDDTVYSMHPLARATAEVAARVYWQVQPGITARVRASRYAGDHRESLRSMKSLGTPDARRHADDRLTRLGRQFAAAKISAKSPLGPTDLVELAVGDDTIGKAIYGQLSAFDHGQLWAMHQMVEPVAPDLSEGDVMIGRLGSTAGQRAQVALVAFWPYHAAIVAFLDWFGWSAPELRSHVGETLRQLRRYAREQP